MRIGVTGAVSAGLISTNQPVHGEPRRGAEPVMDDVDRKVAAVAGDASRAVSYEPESSVK